MLLRSCPDLLGMVHKSVISALWHLSEAKDPDELKTSVLCFLNTPRVRVAAAESMPLLLECARVRGPEYLTQMWHFMCDALIKAIGTEPDLDVLSEIMHSFTLR